MCGIAGKVDFTGNIVSESTIRRMCDAMVHRGPDAEGIHTEPCVGLGERRLSIIDLSERANPPLGNEDNSMWIVSNGEIYNFQELRSSLVENGHLFRTTGDTEVILHLYEEHGVDCLKHLRGMFAFAIWDSRNKVLFAARDRFGEKPFYYRKTPRTFLFGSSISAIIADPEVSIAPDFISIDRYLTHQYTASPRTAFAGICKLPAAHYLMCDASGDLKIERYWSPPIAAKINASEEEIVEELLRLLKESVRMRLIADVPVGVFLSGGIDSGTVASIMAGESTAPIKTFSIGFDEDINELPYAREVARRYGTQHHELVLRPSAAEVVPLLVKHYNEPFADSSAIPTFYVSKFAKEHITVALSGDGGDESFSGYEHYRQTQRWEMVDVVPLPVRRSVARVVTSALDGLPYGNLTSRMIRALHMFGSSLPERYHTQLAIVKEEEKRACYTADLVSLLNCENAKDRLLPLPWNRSMDSLDWMARHDQNHYLPDCLMVKTDVASMANSLEVRCPFLDHKLVEFAATIPNSLKRDHNGGKQILRRAVAGLLPKEVLHKRKTGFGVPLAQWFRSDLAGLLRAVLLDERTAKRGLFRQSFLKRMIDEQSAQKRDWSNRLWAFLFLELWFREYVD